jgi:hypothetical protein
VYGSDAAVVPVRVRVGRENEGGGKRRELDSGSDGKDRDESRCSLADEKERGEIREKGSREETEEEPGPAGDPAGVVGSKKGVAGPGAGESRGE